ncbi:DgyrCDS4432 [Dimorphilus gyrociliatus]|uniref:DgyrCDS4432 n=1 Tax=Dimorphilus gyrociliatus TaxID=2664684 RepID=A0A7I8VLL5_9ANNE|nr:DgyrCDS4432 [Dimorphilus gyrociliatus]
MDGIGLIVLVILYVVILVVGLLASKYLKPRISDLTIKRNEVDLVAGRRISAAIGIFTMTATTVGGGFINGTAESVYTQGVLWTTAPLGIFLGLVIGGFFYAGKMRRERYLTMFDPIQTQCGSLSVSVLYLIHLMADLFWSASILAALGASLNVILGLNHPTAICVSATVAVLYTMFGQMISVAYTDVVQLLLIFIGLILAAPASMIHKSVKNPLSDQWIGEIQPGQSGIWIDLLIAMTLGTIPWQSYFQRVLSLKKHTLAVGLSISAGAFSFTLAIPPALIGVVAKSTNWTLIHSGEDLLNDQSSLTLPVVIYYLTPRPIAIIGLCGIAAAVMSSLDSSILASASLFTHNVYYKTIRCKKSKDSELQWIQRVVTVIIGGGAAALSLSSNSVYGLFILAADIMFVIMFPQLTLSLYSSIPNAYGSLFALIIGLIFRIGCGESTLNLKAFIKLPFYSNASGQRFPFRTLSMCTSAIVLLSVSYLSRVIFKKFPHLDLLGKLEEHIIKRQNNNIKQSALVNNDLIEETSI